MLYKINKHYELTHYYHKKTHTSRLLSKKDTAILLLFDHWKDSSKETFPDEFGDLGELLSKEEISIIFDRIKASK